MPLRYRPGNVKGWQGFTCPMVSVDICSRSSLMDNKGHSSGRRCSTGCHPKAVFSSNTFVSQKPVPTCRVQCHRANSAESSHRLQSLSNHVSLLKRQQVPCICSPAAQILPSSRINCALEWACLGKTPPNDSLRFAKNCAR